MRSYDERSKIFIDRQRRNFSFSTEAEENQEDITGISRVNIEKNRIEHRDNIPKIEV